MNKIIIILLALAGTAYAQTPSPDGPLKTSDVGIDRSGTCWVRGPANTLKQATPTLGTAVPITSATQILALGTWIIVSGGTATIVSSNGSTQTGVASGNAYPL